MRVDIRLLGRLEATLNDVSFVPSATKPRQVLALLALNVGGAVSPATLMDELWGQHQPRAASTSLHTYVSKLRASLEVALASTPGLDAKGILVTERVGYSLRVQPDDVDVDRYERLASTGRTAAERGDHESASRDLAAALALWNGPAMSDLAVGQHLAVDIVRLEESRLSDLDLRIEVDLHRGRHRAVLGELAGLCARFPLSEKFAMKYMLALYRSADQWRALQVCDQLRSRMLEELGVSPSADTEKLHRAILRQDPAVEWGGHHVTGSWCAP